MASLCFQAASFGTSSLVARRGKLLSERNISNLPVRRPRTRLQPLSTAVASTSETSKKDGEVSKPAEKKSSLSELQSNVPTTRNRDWMFFDVARVLVRGGAGGNGVVAFRREKGNARGGPCGGSGGRGGSIIFIATPGANTLANFRGGIAYRGPDGANGGGKSKTGECANDVVVKVPVGTIVRTGGRGEEDKVVLADLNEPGQRFVAAKAGRGGRGNEAFKTPHNTAPRTSELGEPGIERWLNLELKLVADVALVGIPNAGKSTFLRSVSNATPKVADYPFTTIVPNLGVVDGDVGTGMVIADVPGLVEGAHKGIGMGTAFLRHVERSKVVLHIIDGSVSDDEVVYRYRAIRNEMELFNEDLARKMEVVLVNKVDLPDVQARWEATLKDRLVSEIGGVHKRIALVSAMKKDGLRNVLRKLEKLVSVAEDTHTGTPIILGDEESKLKGEAASVSRDYRGKLVVAGWKVERAYRMTNWDYMESVDRFQRILEALGVTDKLSKAGAKDGDFVVCMDREFKYTKTDNVYSAAAMEDGYID